MAKDENDIVLETLLAVKAELSPNMDDTIIRQCLMIEKKYQFQVEDRTQSIAALERVIDANVENHQS